MLINSDYYIGGRDEILRGIPVFSRFFRDMRHPPAQRRGKNNNEIKKTEARSRGSPPVCRFSPDGYSAPDFCSDFGRLPGEQNSRMRSNSDHSGGTKTMPTTEARTIPQNVVWPMA